MEKEKRKGGGRVLIVDDDPLVRGLLSDIFYNVGSYKTDVAVDGFDGIEKIKNNEYDIVFADMAMPRLNGMDFLREIKKINSSMPVVMTTGISSIDMAVNAMKEGAQDFITKPFRIDTVISIADRITGEKKPSGDRHLTIHKH
ncbi:MAG: Fis family two component sigma-54 specific transcriptional regulator protein [bacterium]|nr:MAG: Fis family two component sigma-54 specific transcriptional regulator protein [bacterium]